MLEFVVTFILFCRIFAILWAAKVRWQVRAQAVEGTEFLAGPASPGGCVRRTAVSCTVRLHRCGQKSSYLRHRSTAELPTSARVAALYDGSGSGSSGGMDVMARMEELGRKLAERREKVREKAAGSESTHSSNTAQRPRREKHCCLFCCVLHFTHCFSVSLSLAKCLRLNSNNRTTGPFPSILRCPHAPRPPTRQIRWRICLPRRRIVNSPNHRMLQLQQISWHKKVLLVSQFVHQKVIENYEKQISKCEFFKTILCGRQRK